MRFDRMTTKAQESVRSALDYASRNGHPELYPEHIVRALLLQEEGVTSPVVTKAGADPNALRTALEAKLNSYPRVSGGAETTRSLSSGL